MAGTTKRTLLIDKFFGGTVRDDKSPLQGVASNIEELDIFENEDWIQAEQVMSADALPATSELHSITGRDDSTDTVYGLGKETAGGLARIFQVTTAGVDNPGAWATLFTSAKTAYLSSPVLYHKTSESPQNYIYYIVKEGANNYDLYRYDISGDSEAKVGDLTGLTDTFGRPSIKKIFESIYITHGRFIAKVDDDGTFTEKAFTLPEGQKAIDMIAVGEFGLILARYENGSINQSLGYWWDLVNTTQFDDRFFIPFGGAQWVVNYRGKIIILCAANGKAKFYQLSGNARGAIPIELPGRTFDSIGIETDSQPISPVKTVSAKDGVIYFGLFKTDKSGIYALGQLDELKPIAIFLSKRFIPSGTSDYSEDKPIALFINGPNYYCAYFDNTANTASRCESRNTPDRSDDAVYESIWIDDGDPHQKKTFTRVYLTSYPLGASTALTLSVDSDYSGSYTAVNRPDNSIFNTANGVLGFFRPGAFTDKLVLKVKVLFTSNAATSPKLTGVGIRFDKEEEE